MRTSVTSEVCPPTMPSVELARHVWLPSVDVAPTARTSPLPSGTFLYSNRGSVPGTTVTVLTTLRPAGPVSDTFSSVMEPPAGTRTVALTWPYPAGGVGDDREAD